MDTNNIQQLSEFVVFYPVTAGIVIAAILAAFLLFLSGFASGSEVAFFSLSPQDIDKLNPQKSSADASIEKLRLDSERALATILIMNNFITVTIIMLCNLVFASIIHFGPKAVWLEFVSLTVLLTFLLLLFGEIMPKVYSRQNALKFCRFSVGGILFLRKLFWPLETVFTNISTYYIIIAFPPL